MSTKIFAHRGYSAKYPENTMPAFLAAHQCGAHGIELDVQLSKDGVPVIIHDEAVNRTTNGKGLVKDMTASCLTKLNAGQRFKWLNRKAAIPTLEEVLDWLSKTNLILNIELKNSVFPYKGMEEKVIKMVHDFDLSSRIIYSSFNHDSLVKIHKIDSSAETAALYKKAMPVPWEYAKSIHASAIHPHYRNVTKELIETAQQHHIQVRAYTVNKTKLIKQLISWKIAGIITDNPCHALSCLESSK
ncbi:glycerophosphoryl diester phosphodiesterase [Scopulibacillus daqui]|uniref:Glycerophosphoryl diester phosphodiesterase n=1 Tax=Scopulibacillus daqui TaxID=1469162 RepID=A0ABS2Q1R0_9BACL|nr:glycerophosphodiester phosphodiesterase [Scopulibacillus daqui]MBM7646148.1 glycerophosphoryl diester phosphodiesterase [Scopulibacillus daqui]